MTKPERVANIADRLDTVRAYAGAHDMSRKDALARMLGEAGYDV